MRVHRIHALLLSFLHLTKAGNISNLLYQLCTSVCAQKFIYFRNNFYWILQTKSELNNYLLTTWFYIL